MTTNSICNDKLLTLVGSELSRIGMFIAVSEIEQSAITIYAKLRKAYIESDRKCFVVDYNIKDAVYYDFLSNAVIVDVFSRSRLKQVRDVFELEAAMCLLNRYLQLLSVITGTLPFKAQTIFSDIILNLPPGVRIEGVPIDPQLHPRPSAHSDHLDAMRYAINPPYTQGCPHAQKYPSTEDNVPELCTSCEGDECFDTVNMTVEYGGTCYGFRVDPIALGLHKPLVHDSLKVFKNYLKKGSQLFIANAGRIIEALHKEYEEEE